MFNSEIVGGTPVSEIVSQINGQLNVVDELFYYSRDVLPIVFFDFPL